MLQHNIHRVRLCLWHGTAARRGLPRRSSVSRSAWARGEAAEAGEVADFPRHRGPHRTRPPAADLEPLQPQAAEAQLEVELGLARPQEGGRVPPGALDHPAIAERGLQGEQPPADFLDRPARAAEVDGALPAFLAVDQPVIGRYDNAPLSPRGRGAGGEGACVSPPAVPRAGPGRDAGVDGQRFCKFPIPSSSPPPSSGAGSQGTASARRPRRPPPVAPLPAGFWDSRSYPPR